MFQHEDVPHLRVVLELQETFIVHRVEYSDYRGFALCSALSVHLEERRVRWAYSHTNFVREQNLRYVQIK